MATLMIFRRRGVSCANNKVSMISSEEYDMNEDGVSPDTTMPATTFQEGIAGFDVALTALDESLMAYPVVHQEVFQNSEEWRRLFQHKIVPQLSVKGCLIVAVAGGTNTGKSTVFNLLLKEAKSAARSTAAATRAPVLVTSPARYQHGLDGSILPGFTARSLEHPDDAMRQDLPEETLWVGASSVLPNSIALLDTPDVDSIEHRNWDIADGSRAAVDVVIAVLTPEKYKDARVVEFFRKAHESGRVVVPVMNKANPINEYAAPRAQLDEFVKDAALDSPACFVLPFDYDIETDFSREIRALDLGMSLMEYLTCLDVEAVKRNVYRDTLECFLSESARFLKQVESLRDRLHGMSPVFERHAAALAASYIPQPGEQMGKLLHEQIRLQRPAIVRHIAQFNDVLLHKARPAISFFKHRILGAPKVKCLSDAEQFALLRAQQAGHLKRLTNEFAAFLIESARDMEAIPGSLIQSALAEIEVDAVAESLARDMLGEADVVSEDFRALTAQTIARWWEGNPEQRKFLLEMDALMVFAPSAMLVFVGAFTAGVGAPEIMALAGPVAGEFAARIMESRFSEQWIGLLKPWQEEQRVKLEACLGRRLTQPALGKISHILEIFEGDHLKQLRRCWELCQSDFQKS